MNIRLLIAYVLILMLNACTNPFSVRDPEKPESTSEVYSNTDQPEIVFENLIKAVNNKNVTQYVDVFVGNSTEEPHQFKFEPERYFQNDFIGSWTISDEQSYFNQLKNSASVDYPRLNLSFNDDITFTAIIAGSDQDSVQTNSLEYYFQVNTGDTLMNLTGVTEFKLFKSKTDQFWYIYYWRDNAIDENYRSTWTYLKTLYK